MVMQGVEIDTLEKAAQFGASKGSSPFEAMQIAWEAYRGKSLPLDLQKRILLKDLPEAISRYWVRSKNGDYDDAQKISEQLVKEVEEKIRQGEM